MQDRPLNRREARRLLFRKCPCESGKLYKNCCLEDDIRRLVKRQAWVLKEKKRGEIKNLAFAKNYGTKGKVKITKVKEKEHDERKKDSDMSKV